MGRLVTLIKMRFLIKNRSLLNGKSKGIICKHELDFAKSMGIYSGLLQMVKIVNVHECDGFPTTGVDEFLISFGFQVIVLSL